MQTQPIATIEAQIVERLRRGLGKMVKSVESYGGEFDEDLGQVARRLPAAWVTFAGIMSTRATNTSRNKYLSNGRFVVMVGQRSVKSEQTSRTGSNASIGTYSLVGAIRRLLTNQDLGLVGVSHLQPGAVRTLFNGQLRGDALSVFACEFDTSWIESPLSNQRWPEPAIDPDTNQPVQDDPDAIFAQYDGQLDSPYPDLERIVLNHRLPTTDATDEPDATDIVVLNEDKP